MFVLFGFPCYTTNTAGETAWEARLGLKLFLK